MTKPLEERKYNAYLKTVGWKLVKGSIDFVLEDEKGNYPVLLRSFTEKEEKEKCAREAFLKLKKNLK